MAKFIPWKGGLRAKPTFYLEGWQEFRDNLRLLDRRTRSSVLKKSFSEAMRPILHRAKQLAPRNTGALRRSILIDIRPPRKAGVILVVLFAGVKYAAAVEYGHGSYPPHPYLRPAVEEFTPKFIPTLRDALQKWLEQAAQGMGK